MPLYVRIFKERKIADKPGGMEGVDPTYWLPGGSESLSFNSLRLKAKNSNTNISSTALLKPSHPAISTTEKQLEHSTEQKLQVRIGHEGNMPAGGSSTVLLKMKGRSNRTPAANHIQIDADRTSKKPKPRNISSHSLS